MFCLSPLLSTFHVPSLLSPGKSPVTVAGSVCCQCYPGHGVSDREDMVSVND